MIKCLWKKFGWSFVSISSLLISFRTQNLCYLVICESSSCPSHINFPNNMQNFYRSQIVNISDMVSSEEIYSYFLRKWSCFDFIQHNRMKQWLESGLKPFVFQKVLSLGSGNLLSHVKVGLGCDLQVTRLLDVMASISTKQSVHYRSLTSLFCLEKLGFHHVAWFRSLLWSS